MKTNLHLAGLLSAGLLGALFPLSVTGLTIGIPAVSLATGPESPDRADSEAVVVGLANGDVLEFVAYERADLGVSQGSDSADGKDSAEAVVRYWGSWEAMGLLSDAVVGFNPDAEDLRDLPLGIARLSGATVPTSEWTDALAVLRQDGVAYLIFADAAGPVAVRFADGLDLPDRPADVTETYEDETYRGGTACSACAGDCCCSAGGDDAECRSWTDGSGKDWAECTDGETVVTCWAKGGNCSCSSEEQQPDP